jgi:ATP-binding cassette, subfamily B, bacterial
MDVASGEHVVGDVGDLSSGEQAVIEDLLGRPLKKGALKRGFKVMPRILPYLRPYRKLAIGSVVMTILLAVVALAQPWPLAFVVDSIIGDEPAPGWVTGIFGSSIGGLIALAVGATLLLTLLSGVMTVWNEYLTTSLDQRMVLDFRSDMFQHAQKLSLAFHDNESLGILMYRLNNQASAMGSIVVSLPAVAQSVLTLVGMAYISVHINPLLALLALGTTPFIVYSTTYYTDRIEPRLYRVRGLGAMNLSIVYESMAMMRVVLAFGTQRREFTRFRKQGEHFRDETVGLTVRQTAFKFAVQFITSAGTAAVIGVGAYQAVHGQISAGELLVVLSYIAQVYLPLEELTNTITNFQQWFINLLMSFDLMDREPDVKEKPDALPLKTARPEIEFDGVGFGYESRPGVLEDITMRIPPGRAVAIAGPTGAGKSTLVSLLPRFYDTTEGSVRIDGQDVRDVKLADLRNQFSIVLQEPLLFSGTIANNIRYAKPDASDEEVIEAAKAANAHEFISALPKGYETPLGERGAKISGGERQRIAVARAFLRDAPVLILDEPTSSIDSRTESVILDALDRLMQGRTTILIAHRLSTLRDVHKIVVLDEGRLVEEGSHEELIANGGLYRQLWEAQTGGGAKATVTPLPAVVEDVHARRLRETLDRIAHAERRVREANERTAAAIRRTSELAPAVTGTAAQPAAEEDLRLRETLDRIAHAERRASKAEQRTRTAIAGATGSAPALPRGGVDRDQARPIARTRKPSPPARERPQRASLPRPKIVLLGMLTKIPVGGVAWLVAQYAAGFERLGYEVYYVEAHSRTPSMFMGHQDDDGTKRAVSYLADVAARFGFRDRWAFQALHEHGRCYGMSAGQLDRLYRDAALIINMHGGTLPFPEHAATDRLVFLGTDPVEVELEVHRGDRRAIEFLDQHVAFFTWGLNFGNPDCKLPWASPFRFVPSPPPVVLEFWENDRVPDGAPFTTIGNWRQSWRNVRHEDRVYRWSKHQQFLKILNLPMRSRTPIELALSSYEHDDRLLLAEHGWRVRPGFELSRDPDSYRDYIVGSAGELSVAKEQNIHFRSGWFSERSATYLAAGRPVILQDTGFGATLPTGEGLFAFTDLESAAEALSAVQDEADRHRRAASEIAREYLSHEIVLGDMLEHVGLRADRSSRPPRRSSAASFPGELSLEVRSRRPLELGEDTVERVLARPVPTVTFAPTAPMASVVVPVVDNLACTRLALESLLANTSEPPYEVLVVDNGSGDATREYLEVLAARNRHVRVIRNERNSGFAAACHQGLAASAGDLLVLLNNDTIVPPGWLQRLSNRLDDPELGIVAPVTNRCAGAAQISVPYATYEEMLRFARKRAEAWDGRPAVDIELAELFCAGVRREVLETAGLFDERFETGSLEEGFTRRVRDAGYRVVYVEELFVHHFGEASLPSIDDRTDPAYAAMAVRVHDAVRDHVPVGSRVLVVSSGDDALVGFDGREAWHFPQLDDGSYAGEHPADDEEAIAHLERLRGRGADYLVVPAASLWWLEHYEGFRRHLKRYRRPSDDPETAVIYELSEPADTWAEEESTA